MPEYIFSRITASSAVGSTIPMAKSAHATASQLHPSDDEIARCRDAIHTRMPQTTITVLQQFLSDLFADDDLVRAYLLCTNSTTSTGLTPAMPLDLCERAAYRAGTYTGLRHAHERDLATVAAFVQSCGFYWCAREQALGEYRVHVNVSPRIYRSRIHMAQRGLLEEPLRQLRRRQLELGSTLAQVLGMDNGSCEADPQQVARIQSAIGVALHTHVP